jgi:2-polyprenyl-3-methyl-5-hydroxy-6-metoxy-1,4-benzoquinol methylase
MIHSAVSPSMSTAAAVGHRSDCGETAICTARSFRASAAVKMNLMATPQTARTGQTEVVMRELQREIAVKMTARNPQGSFYRLDDSSTEAGLLRPKVVFVPDVTEDVLHRSGIKRGMRALDLGCGAGDASLWIAKLVGPTGLVVGVDESVEVIDIAQKRATVAGQCYWTRFVAADPNSFIPPERYDVVVVRRALLRQRERVAFLWLSAAVDPDGIIMIVAGKSAETFDRR